MDSCITFTFKRKATDHLQLRHLVLIYVLKHIKGAVRRIENKLHELAHARFLRKSQTVYLAGDITSDPHLRRRLLTEASCSLTSAIFLFVLVLLWNTII